MTNSLPTSLNPQPLYNIYILIVYILYNIILSNIKYKVNLIRNVIRPYEKIRYTIMTINHLLYQALFSLRHTHRYNRYNSRLASLQIVTIVTSLHFRSSNWAWKIVT